VGVWIAADIETARIREHCLVPVGRRIKQHDLGAGRDTLSLEFDILSCGPHHVLDRSYPAQHLLDGNGEQRRVGLESLELIGMLLQRQHAARQHVPRRLVPADEDEQGLMDQRRLVEPVTVDLGLDEDPDQVIASPGATAVIEHRLDIGGVLDESLGRRLQAFRLGVALGREHVL
jgi:hypothetical protein